MAPIQKLGSGEGRRRPSRLALLTALSVAGALMYVFVLLVPAWRTVHVDRRLIAAFLANHSAAGGAGDDARLWEALARDPLLRSRSANAFRECLASTEGDADGGSDGANVTTAGRGRKQHRRWEATEQSLERHLLELLAGFNVSMTTSMTLLSMSTPSSRLSTMTTDAMSSMTTGSMSTTNSLNNSSSYTTTLSPNSTSSTPTTSPNSTSPTPTTSPNSTSPTPTTSPNSPSSTTTTSPNSRHASTKSTPSSDRHRQRLPAASNEHCWFLNLHWSDGDTSGGALSGPHRSQLRCTRALFLLAISLLLCQCVSLTGALYSCFASKMPQPCRLVLLLVHCLVLSQLVATAILQDVSARLAGDRLRDLLAAAGFPDGCAAAVDARRGVCSLALLCILCVVSGLHLLLLLLPMGQLGRRGSPAAGGDKMEGGGGEGGGSDRTRERGANAAECDDTDDTNPLL